MNVPRVFVLSHESIRFVHLYKGKSRRRRKMLIDYLYYWHKNISIYFFEEIKSIIYQIRNLFQI